MDWNYPGFESTSTNLGIKLFNFIFIQDDSADIGDERVEVTDSLHVQVVMFK